MDEISLFYIHRQHSLCVANHVVFVSAATIWDIAKTRRWPASPHIIAGKIKVPYQAARHPKAHHNSPAEFAGRLATLMRMYPHTYCLCIVGVSCMLVCEPSFGMLPVPTTMCSAFLENTY